MRSTISVLGLAGTALAASSAATTTTAATTAASDISAYCVSLFSQVRILRRKKKKKKERRNRRRRRERKGGRGGGEKSPFHSHGHTVRLLTDKLLTKETGIGRSSTRAHR
jgi:hypothetical protein